jgi:integrase
MKITQKLAESLRWEGKARTVWDDGLPGFGVRVHRNQSSYVAYRTIDGQRAYSSLGKVGEMSLADARTKALLSKPLAHTSTVTLAEAAKEYLNRWAIPRKKTWRADKRRIERRILPALGNRRLDDVKRHDVAALQASIVAPYESNRVIEVLKGIFGYCKKHGIADIDNPAAGIPPNREQSRERYLTVVELKRLQNALSFCQEPQASVIRLLIFTGCRKSEILNLRWEDVGDNVILLRTTKNGKSRLVPLSRSAEAVITGIPRRSEYLFPSPSGKGPLREIRKTWVRACRIAGLKDLRLHDLRRTVASLLIQSGTSMPEIAKVLGHSNSYITQVYARLDNGCERRALDKFETLIEG